MDKFKLTSTDLMPPGGWKWRCGEHGAVLEAPFFNELLFKVNGYLRANGIPVEGSKIDWLKDQLCQQNDWER